MQIASLLALILAWVYIFDTVMKERELLDNTQEGIVGAIPRDVENPASASQPHANQNGRSGTCMNSICHTAVFHQSNTAPTKADCPELQ